jgi:hypothetical protein
MGQYSSWMVGNGDCSDFFSVLINHVLYLNHVSTVFHLLSKRIIYSGLKAAVCCCCASRYVPRLKIELSQPTESRGDQYCSLCRHHEQPNYPTVLFVLSAPICDTGLHQRLSLIPQTNAWVARLPNRALTFRSALNRVSLAPSPLAYSRNKPPIGLLLSATPSVPDIWK